MIKKQLLLFFALLLVVLNPYFTEAEVRTSKIPDKRVPNTAPSATKTPAEKKTPVKKYPGNIFFGYLNLQGTVIVSSTKKDNNKAIIMDMFTKKKAAYREGAELPYGIKLKKIEARRVVLEKSGVERALDVGAKSNYFREIKKLKRKGYRKIASNEWIVNSHYLFKSSQDMINLAVDSGLSLKKSRRNPGIEITREEKTKMAGLGFRKGDKVIGINGISLRGAADLVAAYKNMQDVPYIDIKVLRNGKPVKLRYWVSKRGSPRYNMNKVFSSEKIRASLSSM